MVEHFTYDERLGINIPTLAFDWEEYDIATQQVILDEWEKIRGHIPDRISELEQLINQKQAELENEANFKRSCQLNGEIAELASVINDLWIWFRVNERITGKMHS